MTVRDWVRAALAALSLTLGIYLALALPPNSDSATPSRAYAATPIKIFLPLVMKSFSGAAIAGCPQFPADNPWNRDVSADPVDSNSTNLINSIGAATKLHPDFGSNLTYGIPYTIVAANQVSVPITIYPPDVGWPDQADPGPYPTPLNAPVEAGGDKHVLVAQSGTCKLFELYNATQIGAGWSASNGSVFNLKSNALRPDCWTSADAAGLPILPGLVRRDEVLAGEIKHALRFTVSTSRAAFVHPATHYASSDTSANRPPMGMRVRMKASYDTAGFTGASKIILTALKKYGMFVADNGGNWFISGATDGNWDDNDLDQMKSVPGSAFEVVQMDTIYTSTNCP